ncbi:hypothetical protein [Terrisporobacter hibernicus]|uniref:Uncharacterized protein n=1 Tax=Terrisporobacter hibernicus TaxID=2813371 RepID=A0AAX2ZI77_9FIRM|nr:hypothetical protein [Terrisporobacter hibernicus]UEL48090.1 hypothetical protein JW646_01155 [Terrisporobacter hibernicus]
MIKQEIVKAFTGNGCIKKSKPIIEKFSKEGYELTDTEITRSPMYIIHILTFNKED